jgi:hypothetical protein
MIGALENQPNLVANIARLASARINSHGRNLAFRNVAPKNLALKNQVKFVADNAKAM